jgi:hypothetical protein
VIVDPINQAIPEAPAPDTPVFLAPDVNKDDQSPTAGSPTTTAGKLMDQYKKIGDAQKHVFGVGLPGSTPPNFNLKVPGVNAPALPPGTAPSSTAATSPKPTATGGGNAAPPQSGNTVKPPTANPSAPPPGFAPVVPKPAASTPTAIKPTAIKPPAPKPPEPLP